MKKFDEIAFDFGRCRQEVGEFRALLAAKNELSESTDILPFFRARPQMAILFGMYNSPGIGWANRIAWEFDLFGDFACDLAVGEWERGAYCLVEFEDAREDSVFKREGKKATRAWGPKFEHGYSQILDWLHKLDGRSAADCLARFGRHAVHARAVLIVGRDHHLDEGERQRLKWRNDNVVVRSDKIICLTFDELLRQFTERLGILTAVEASALAALPPRLPGQA